MMEDERKQAIEYVRVDGRNLAKVRDAFRDDEEVVAAAILGREFGGVHVLTFASKRLQDSCREPNSRLNEIIVAANKWQELRERIRSAKISVEEKNEFLQQIEDLKSSLLDKYFLHKKKKDSQSEDDFYMNNIHIPDDLKKMIDQGVVGTCMNYSSDMIHNIAEGIYLYLGEFVGVHSSKFDKIANNHLVDFISRKNDLFGIPLRFGLREYYEEIPTYPVLGQYGRDRDITEAEAPSDVVFAVDMLKLSLKNTPVRNEHQEKVLQFLENLDFHLAAKEYVIRTGEDATVMIQSRLHLRELFESLSIDDFYEVIQPYFQSLNPCDVFRNDSIVIEDVTESARNIFTNIDQFHLKKSAHAILLGGRIQISSDKGYRGSDKEQEDAVGSVVRDERHFINIVADGVGGVEAGAVGSRELVQELTIWYDSLPSDVLDNVELLSKMLDEKIYAVHQKLIYKYGDNQALTTVVVALTAGDKTILANVGDSTAYTYVEGTDRLVELTTLDSNSYGLSYEEARHNPNNNVIRASVGSYYKDLHLRVIQNVGQRIILSSDGVTDLISEDHFKQCFRERIPAKDIVMKAKNDPDVESGIRKTVDNISAIVVDLPNAQLRRERGY